MFASLAAALRLFGTPAFSRLLYKSIGLTLALFVLGCALLEFGIGLLPQLGSRAVNQTLEILAPILTLMVLWFAGGPVAALFAGLFLDGLAGHIEATDYPGDPPAPGVTLTTGIRTGLALTLAVLGFDIALLPLDIALPGPAELATLLVNGWLLGREYFQLAALRHLPPERVTALYRRHRGSIAVGGLLIALASMVPLIDLVAPLFGVAFMVHLFKRIQHEAAR